MRYISSFLGAVLGFLLYPVSILVAAVKHSISLIFRAAILIPTLSILGGMRFANSLGNRILVSLFITAGLTGLALGVLPLYLGLLGGMTLVSLINAPFTGIYIGWTQGLKAIGRKIYKNCFSLSTENTPQVPNVVSGDYVNMVMRLQGPALNLLGNNTRPAMTEEQFEALQLSFEELQVLKNNTNPLTAEELLHLEGIEDMEVKRTLQAYRNLGRLDIDECAILLERPELQNTIILFKQYQNSDGQWGPVPGVAHIFDRSQLKTAFEQHHSTHPVNRELVTNPPAYVVNGQACNTRYRIHPYSVEGKTLSQEKNALATFLRGKLPAEAPQVAIPQEDVESQGPQPATVQQEAQLQETQSATVQQDAQPQEPPARAARAESTVELPFCTMM